MEGILKNPEAREAFLITHLSYTLALLNQVCDQVAQDEGVEQLRSLLQLNRTTIEMTLGVDLGL